MFSLWAIACVQLRLMGVPKVDGKACCGACTGDGLAGLIQTDQYM